MSYVMQKRIANVFRRQTDSRTAPSCAAAGPGVRRFQDNYDLLRCQISDTLEEVIDNNIDYLPWQDILKLFPYETDAHRRYYAECPNQREVDVEDIFAMHLVVLLAQTSL